MTYPSNKRKKVKIKAHALENADVHFISLVNRGANRIPFRVLKSEQKPMINLSNLFTTKKADTAPRVVAIVTPGAIAANMALALKAEGYEVTETVTKDDDGVAILSIVDGYEAEDVTTFKMSDDVAVMVEHVEKSFNSYETENDFAENIKKAGFFPGFRIATEVMMETVANVVHSTEKGETPNESVTKALKGYQAYVMSLVKSIPATAFKMETLAPVVIEKTDGESGDETTAEDTGTEGTTEVVEKGMLEENTNKEAKQTTGKKEVPGKESQDNTDSPNANKVVTEKAEDEGNTEVTTDETTEGDTGTTEVVKAEDAKGVDTDALVAKMAEIVSTEIGKVTTAVNSLSAQVEKVEGAAAQMQTRMDNVEEVAKSATEAVQGTVIGGETREDQHNATARKADEDDGLFDTAFGFSGYEG